VEYNREIICAIHFIKSASTYIKKLQPGDNECLYKALKYAIKPMDKAERECISACDEVSIKKNLTYNSFSDIIDSL